MNHWTLIIGMMLVTFLPRYLPLLFADKMVFPEWLERAFNYVPIAVLSAIIAQTTLIHDGAVQFNWHNAHLIAALVAVAGAAVIRFDQITPHFLMGFLLLQLANFTYAAGQVLYKHLVARHPSDLPHYRRFGYFYLGALIVVLPAFLPDRAELRRVSRGLPVEPEIPRRF